MASHASGGHRLLDNFNAAHARRQLPYYDVLGLPQSATESEIVRAYRKLSLRLHPDKKGGSHEKFQELNKAYRCLRDPECRRKYDDCGFDEDNISTAEVDQFVDAFFGEGARSVDGRSGDWRMNSIENYVRIKLDEVPLHMKDIVRIGLKYMVSLDIVFENVLLMQHARVDILYLMVGLIGHSELTQEIFETEESYTITYYDNPLQPGIAPRWSDQNSMIGRKKDLPRRELNWEEFQRRQKHALAMLENAPADPMIALEEKYRAKMLATEHVRARIAAEKRNEAIRGQDVYEDDAELDVNAFADLLAQEKRDGAGAAHASGEAAEADTVSPPARDSGAERAPGGAAVPEGEEGAVALSRGTEDVLGCSSDGILFVASGGKVLRNEGPPMPRPAAEEAWRQGGGLKAERRPSPSASSPSPSGLLGCLCLPASAQALLGLFRPTGRAKHGGPQTP